MQEDLSMLDPKCREFDMRCDACFDDMDNSPCSTAMERDDYEDD